MSPSPQSSKKVRQIATAVGLCLGIAATPITVAAMIDDPPAAEARATSGPTTNRVLVEDALRDEQGSVVLKGHVLLHRRGGRLCGEVWALSQNEPGTWQGDVPRKMCIGKVQRSDHATTVGACLNGFGIAFTLPRTKREAWLRAERLPTRRVPVRQVRIDGGRSRLAFVVVPSGVGTAGISWSRTGAVAPSRSFGDTDRLCGLT